MAKRSHNRHQEWYCDVCDRITVHRIGDDALDIGDGVLSSDWFKEGDFRAYQRQRVCEECSNPLTTVELRHEDFVRLRKAEAELERLRAFRDSVRAAFDKLDADSSAQRRR